MFYCMKCQKIQKDSDASIVFATGYRRLNGVDYHLGRCHNHSVCLKTGSNPEPVHLIKVVNI